jgi:Late embryogenesis abundant protein.
MKRFYLAIIASFLFITSCDVVKNAAEVYNLTQCEYKFNSISNLNLAGVQIQGSSLNPIALVGLTAAFSQNSIPLQFTLNLDVKNPNNQPASLNKMYYILEIDNKEMTTGDIDASMQIGTGQTANVPINIAFDLKNAMKGETGDAVKNMAFNFVGLGDRPTNVTIKLRPTLAVGERTLTSPVYIPVSFTYGGKNN